LGALLESSWAGVGLNRAAGSSAVGWEDPGERRALKFAALLEDGVKEE